MVLALGLQLNGLRNAGVLILVFAEALHAQRGRAAMHHLMIRESCNSLVILKAPAIHVIAAGAFKIGIV